MFKALVFALACAACAAQAPAQETQVLGASYPEGALWQDERLLFAEMGADRVSVIENATRRAFFTQTGCGPTALAPYGQGFLVLCHRGGRVVAVSSDGQELRRWDRDSAGVRLVDPNDATADGAGGVYFSDPGRFSRGIVAEGRVMHLSADGVLTPVAGPLWYPNGVFAESQQRQLYVSEHLGGRILRYDIGEGGRLSGPSVFADVAQLRGGARYSDPFPETGPDGVEVGPDGNIYVAIYGEGSVLRISPMGAVLGVIDTPSRFTTSIGFSASGRAAITSVYENAAPPYRGEVRLYAPGALTSAAE